MTQASPCLRSPSSLWRCVAWPSWSVAYLVISPGPVRLSLSRRRPGAEPGPGSLDQATTAVSQAIARLLGRRGTAGSDALALELAGCG